MIRGLNVEMAAAETEYRYERLRGCAIRNYLSKYKNKEEFMFRLMGVVGENDEYISNEPSK